MPRQHRQFASPRLAVPVLAALTAVVLTACGSSAGGATTQPSAQSGSSPANSNPGSGASAGGSGRAPAASGKVAAITGRTMQVQSQQSGQIAVSWKNSTKFSHTVSTTAAKIKKGDCVVAVAKSGSNPTQSSRVTAGTLTVSKSVNGACTIGLGTGGGSGRSPSGGFPSGGNVPSGGFPSGTAPSGFPSGARPGAAGTGFGGFTAGKVQSISGHTLTVTSRQPGSNSKTTRTVVVDAATSVQTQAPTTAKSLHVGKCVVAVGRTDSSGSVAARTVQISDPTNGQCGGFAGGNGGGNG